MKRESGETPGRIWASHPPKLSHNALSLQELTRSKQVSNVREKHKVTETRRERLSKKKKFRNKKSYDAKPGRMGVGLWRENYVAGVGWREKKLMQWICFEVSQLCVVQSGFWRLSSGAAEEQLDHNISPNLSHTLPQPHTHTYTHTVYPAQSLSSRNECTKETVEWESMCGS